MLQLTTLCALDKKKTYKSNTSQLKPINFRCSHNAITYQLLYANTPQRYDPENAIPSQPALSLPTPPIKTTITPSKRTLHLRRSRLPPTLLPLPPPFPPRRPTRRIRRRRSKDNILLPLLLLLLLMILLLLLLILLLLLFLLLRLQQINRSFHFFPTRS